MNPQADNLDFLTVSEVAAQLRLSTYSVRDMLVRGEIPGYKLSGAWRVRRQDLLAWVEKRSNQKEPQK